MKLTSEAFAQNFADTLGLTSLPQGADTPLRQLKEFDSMNRLLVMSMCDSVYGIVLDPRDLDRCTSIRELHAFCESKV